MSALKILQRYKKIKESKKYILLYNVVGVTFDNRQEIIQKYYKQFKVNGKRRECNLILQDDNKYDKNAVAIFICGQDKYQNIGYISKDQNKFIRQNFENISQVKIDSIFQYQGIYCVKIKVWFEQI